MADHSDRSGIDYNGAASCRGGCSPSSPSRLSWAVAMSNLSAVVFKSGDIVVLRLDGERQRVQVASAPVVCGRTRKYSGFILGDGVRRPPTVEDHKIDFFQSKVLAFEPC